MLETIGQWGFLFAAWYLLHYLLKVFNVALEDDDTNINSEKNKNA